MSGVSMGGDIRRLMSRLHRLESISLADVNAVLANAMRTSTRQRFIDQTAPDETSWKQSARAREEGGVTLTNTARLRNSIRAKSDSTGFAVGTNVIYARRHQLGDKTPLLIKAKTQRGLRFRVGGRWITKGSVRVKLPARPFLGISREDIAEIKATMEEMIANAE